MIWMCPLKFDSMKQLIIITRYHNRQVVYLYTQNGKELPSVILTKANFLADYGIRNVALLLKLFLVISDHFSRVYVFLDTAYFLQQLRLLSVE
jgi:hypothetical protein